MGYFSNGTEGEIYYERWCSRCVHDINEDCPVWAAHLMYSYQAQGRVNKGDNALSNCLHMLIPKANDGLSNAQCLMFIERDNTGDLFEVLP